MINSPALLILLHLNKIDSASANRPIGS